MKTLKRLVGVIALTFVFAFAAFADCLPPEPGIMSSPPCSGAQITPDDPVAAADVIEVSLTTLDVLLAALSIF